MGRRAAIIGVAALMLLLVGLGLHWTAANRWTAVDIPDVTQPVTLLLRPHGPTPLMGRVTGISVWVTGHIDGEATVWAGNWERKRLVGAVNWGVYHDWSSPDCVLNYQPVEVRSGNISVKYRFH